MRSSIDLFRALTALIVAIAPVKQPSLSTALLSPDLAFVGLSPALPEAATAVGAVKGVSPVDESKLLWQDDFQGTTGLITAYDPAWIMIFGRLNIDAKGGAVRAHPGTEDMGDDYGFKPSAATSVLITADVYSDTRDAVGLTVVCQRGAVDRSLYEFSLWKGGIQLFRYDGGGNPSIYTTLATSETRLPNGNYRVVFAASFSGGQWTLRGEVQDPSNGNAVLGSVAAVDSRHGTSVGQGIGFFDNSGQSSRVHRITVHGHASEGQTLPEQTFWGRLVLGLGRTVYRIKVRLGAG